MTHYISVPLYNLLPLLACSASPAYNNLLFSLPGQTQILFLCKVPLVPWPCLSAKGSLLPLPLNSIGIYLYILTPQPQDFMWNLNMHMTCCILRDLRIKLWLVLHYFCWKIKEIPFLILREGEVEMAMFKKKKIRALFHSSYFKESKQPFYVFIYL